ncbi:uncharacterized protein BCR38DRAFT_180905 [Pseudomassariella vexata]|uniref:Acetate kinase n=1 Tax=Pseudomassariella vexata TaxID=1141098 RepID=A0A1Y2E4I5_9PEZI|nr:uncharacterized protein BCR38DRAFT_180905 [Pseudomassariella vexata]ORY66470.1 hypothetical protein BCR38DRAFT_180905 [Pseudomassariella vexata]
MATSSSSSSSRSYASSAFSLPAYAPNLAATSSPVNSNWTPNSPASSAFTDELSTPQDQLRPLDLGPPGYQATIVLFEGTADERTVYLGPWEVVGNEHRRIVWQGSYQLERLEHFLPSSASGETFPHTLHARHRPFSDPCQLEQCITFRERHRVRYTRKDGVPIHDQAIEVKYDFTTIESSLHFQGDLRRKDLIDCFDVDVVWTDTQGRTDAFGNVRGIGTVQRLKLWSDRVNTLHSLTIFANRSDRRYKEYMVDYFEGEIRGRDDRRRTLRLSVRGRRGSGSGSRRTLSSAFRPRQRSVTANPDGPSPLDIRYLGIQFSRNEDYRRFLDAWLMAHSSDSEYNGIQYPHDVFELPSPQMLPGVSYEILALPTVPEPAEGGDEELMS